MGLPGSWEAAMEFDPRVDLSFTPTSASRRKFLQTLHELFIQGNQILGSPKGCCEHLAGATHRGIMR
jgi:hypothetical protein